MRLSSFCIIIASILLLTSLTSNSVSSQSITVSDEEIRDYYRIQLGEQIEYVFDASVYDPGTLVFFRFIPSEPFEYTRLSYYNPTKQSLVGLSVDGKIEYRPGKEIIFGDERLSLSNQGSLVENGYRTIEFEKNKEEIKNVILAEYKAKEDYESLIDVSFGLFTIIYMTISLLYLISYIFAFIDIRKNNAVPKKFHWYLFILLFGFIAAIIYFYSFNKKKPLRFFVVTVLILFFILFLIVLSVVNIPVNREELANDIRESRNQIHVDNYGWFSDNGFNNKIIDTTKTVITDNNWPLEIDVSNSVIITPEKTDPVVHIPDPKYLRDVRDELIAKGGGIMIYPNNFSLNPGDSINYITADILSDEKDPIYCGIHVITEKPNWVFTLGEPYNPVLRPCSTRNNTYNNVVYETDIEYFKIEVPSFAKSGQYAFNFVLCKADSKEEYSYPDGISKIYECTKESDNYRDDTTFTLTVN